MEFFCIFDVSNPKDIYDFTEVVATVESKEETSAALTIKEKVFSVITTKRSLWFPLG
jgi:hypothetical protein